ncbi:MAG: methylated-DNA--[protein]-cysteine S-methyltransferase [Methylacidiphilales bacterium]|nr:methylated-DNA--[protein]-cysteine S-methyltransferase [Candidatus Methylacidiphilales bacterium]
MTLYSLLESPLGELLLIAHDDSLNGIYFTDQHHAPQVHPDWVRRDDAPVFGELRKQLREYTAGERQVFDLPIELTGTKFQVGVWQQILAIPFGETVTYTELANRIGDPQAVRAVGAAAGANPICWVLPCHRVVGKDGSLTGYAGGLTRKKALLDFEAARHAGREIVLAWDEPACIP